MTTFEPIVVIEDCGRTPAVIRENPVVSVVVSTGSRAWSCRARASLDRMQRSE
ncbi:hypothetical protein [Amycolatopsis mediterranei]|uniref:Uncharacterized protein n=1 Tax=Amycolatopsis mediterranei (strain S699) TaxID=713604 RepID=A0A9R0NS44_AMYMS|nr:hypothetical protein [Amycolatopsis mediterranei]AEK39621.1 hypothetical protein RAM_05645 [Amycolatopsis mediterranei S699]UZF68074.1 hypothetical protein ISP_001119 [Amycolatopsis mediterranei]